MKEVHYIVIELEENKRDLLSLKDKIINLGDSL